MSVCLNQLSQAGTIQLRRGKQNPKLITMFSISKLWNLKQLKMDKNSMIVNVCLNLISGISFSIERRAVDWMSTGLPIEGQIGNQASKWRDDRPHSTERLTLNLLSAITQRESWKCAKKIGPIVNHIFKWKWKCKMCNHASKWRDDRPHSTERLAFNLLLATT